MVYQSKITDFVKDNNEKYVGEWCRILNIELSQEQVTFKGKMVEPVHSWFRLTPSFSPYLVRFIMKNVGCNQNETVLDPFAGIGTTLIECKKAGITSIGVEINPIFCEVMKTVTEWNLNLQKLKELVRTYLKGIMDLKNTVSDIDVTQFPKKLGISLPKIRNVFRWWDKEVLKDLLVAREVLKRMDEEDKYKRFLWVGLASTVIEVANVKRCHPTISFADNPFNLRRNNKEHDNINRNVVQVLSSKLDKMLIDLENVKEIARDKIHTNVKIIKGDSRHLSRLLTNKNVDVVITSPPYPNRYSYVWETRPYLYFFEIFKTPREASDLDIVTIGGTWGRATFSLKDVVIKPLDNNVADSVGYIIEKIRESSNLLANYVQKYFNDMYVHFTELYKVTNDSARCAYVIGNSKIKGVEIPSDVILAKLLECVGFSVDKIVRIRTRLGKRGLYEAIVYATKSD